MRAAMKVAGYVLLWVALVVIGVFMWWWMLTGQNPIYG